MIKFVILFACYLAYLGVGFAHVNEDYGELASLVCKTTHGSKNHLTTLASVIGVIDHLRSLPSGHKLEECRDKYLKSLEQLVHVVEAASDDVCGEEKLALLEEYHRRYISKIRKHEKERKHSNKAPRLAKVFFMQYAARVSSICEQAALEAINGHQLQINDEEMAKVGSMKNLTDTLGMTDFSKGFAGIYLFWDMIASLELNKRDKFAKYLIQGGEIRINVQMRQANNLVEIQAICRNQLKPIYSKSILPVLRIADLGYYPESAKLVTTEGTIRNLVYATQICETLLPIRIYQNDNLEENQVVALSEDDVAQMYPYKSQDVPQAQPLAVAPSSLSGAELDFVGIKFDKVKASVTSRGNIMLNMLKRMVKRLKKMKSLVKGFKLLERGANKNLEPIDEDHLEEMAEQSLQAYEKPASGMVRRKRELVCFILACIALVIVFIFLVAYYKRSMERTRVG